MRRCLFHRWPKWTLADLEATDVRTGRKVVIGVQWRDCKRCGFRQQQRVGLP